MTITKMKINKLTWILGLMMILVVAAPATAILFETYARDLETNEPIPSTINVGGVSKYSGGRDDKVTFVLDTDLVYDTTYSSPGYKPDTDPVFFDDDLYYCQKGTDCNGLTYGNFRTDCEWKASKRWECRVSDKKGNSIVFLYFGKVGDYYKVGRVNWIKQNYDPTIEPISDVTVSETEEVSIQAVASDPTGDTIHYSFAYVTGPTGPNMTTMPGASIDSDGLFTWQTGYEDEGTYDVTIYAHDAYTSVSSSFTITVEKTNRAPDVTDPSIATLSYNTEDSIICVPGTGSDPDTEDVAGLQSSYRWYFDDTEVSGQTSDILDCGSVSGCDKDVDVKCSQQVTDGDLSSAEKFSNEVTIVNTAPIISSVSITDPAYTDDTLTCTPSGWTDADGDTEDYTYEWQFDSTTVNDQTAATLDCSSVSGCDKAVEVTCIATPTDGTDSGTSQSDSVTITNTAPSITSATITDPVYTDSTISCTPAGWNDIDGDTEGYDYEWQFDGTRVDSQTAATLDCDSVSGCDRDVDVTCIITPNDGETNGTSQSDTVTVSNTAPSITSVSVTDPAYTDDTITCTPAGWNDIDGDTEGYDYEWQFDGTRVDSQTAATLDCDSVSGCDKDVAVTCIATPTDGTDSGTSQSDSVTILNTAPSITDVSVTDPAYTNTTITCTPGGWNDIDGDSAGYSYAWFNNDDIINGETSSTLADSNFVKTETITCQVTPDDGDDTGIPLNDSVTILNTAPYLTANPILNTTSPYTNDILMCNSGTYYDEDGDSEAASYYRWFENSVEITGEDTNTLDLSLPGLDKTDVINCEQKVSDGTENSTWYQSDSATILNSAPVFDHALANQTIDEDTTFSYDINASDIDLDTLTYSVNDTDFNIDANGVLSWTTVADWFGTIPLTITVSDGEVDTTAQMSVIVNPVNDIPYLVSPIQNITWPEDTVDTSLNISQHFADVDLDILGYTSTTPANVAVSIDNSTGIVTLTPAGNYTGINYIIFTASDGINSTVSNNVTLNITPVNDAPNLISAIPDMTWPEDTSNASLNVSQYFTDIDGDTLTFTSTSSANFTISINSTSGIVNITPALNFFGTESITLTAQDPSNLTADSNPISLNITPVNDVPIITSTPTTSTLEDALYNYDVDATDVDQDTLTYSLIVNPAGMTINSSTGLIAWTPTNADVGNNGVTVQVDDGNGGITTQGYTLQVNNTNDAPIINTTTPPVNATEDSLYTYDFNASDDDIIHGDSLTWSTDHPNATIDPATGVFTWTPVNDDVGSILITVYVNDTSNAQDSHTWNLTVIDSNDAPIASNIVASPATPYTDEDLTCSFDATDIDQDTYVIYSNITWFNGTANVNTNDTLNSPVMIGGPYNSHLVISEVNYDDNVDDQNEYVELFNPTSQDIVINSSWVIGDGDGNDTLCDAVIPPGGHYLIADNGGIYAPIADCTMATIGTGLANTADSARIYDADGIMVDGVGWGGETVEGTSATDVTDLPIVRTPFEYFDTDDNSVDFTAGTKNPQSTSNPKLSLDSSLTNKGESWTCQLTIFDNEGGVNTYNSTAAVIQNSIPSVTNVTILPDPANEADNLTGTGTYTDADNDASASTFRWFRNGALIAGETTQSLNAGNFSEGDNVTFEYTPHDGTVAGTTVNTTSYIYSVPPIVTINSPANNSNFTSQTFAINVSTNENATCRYELSNNASGTITSSFALSHIGTVDTTEDGSFTLTIYCDDELASTGQSSIDILVDSTSPLVTINTPVSTLYSTSTVTLNASTNELADCNYTINGGAQQSLYTSNTTGSTPVAIQHGNNTINTSCQDIYGNANSSESVSFTADIIAPANITDLTAASTGAEGEIQLNWTAPGDDNMTGTAVSYIMKQSTSPINNITDFNTASYITGSESVTPAAAGTAETFTATGLVTGQAYYFAIIATDDVGHNSSVVMNATSAPVSHDVAVNSISHNISATAYIGDSVLVTANVSNEGSLSETINITFKENGAYVDSQSVNLAAGASQNIQFAYNPTAAGAGKSLSVEASITSLDSNTANNMQSTPINIWSVADNFALTWVDPALYPDANEAGATFYAWARIENLNSNDFDDLTVTVDTDGLTIADTQNSDTSAAYTYSTFTGLDMQTYWYEINSGAAESRDISVSIGNAAYGDDITITRTVTFP